MEVPITQASAKTRFDRLTTLQIVNPHAPDLDDTTAHQQQQIEMEQAWEQDWSQL